VGFQFDAPYVGETYRSARTVVKAAPKQAVAA